MDITSILRENDISSPFFILSTLFFLLFIIKQTKSFFSKNIKNFPPGPPKLPIIGNLHQVGDDLLVSMANIANKYGPLISLQLGKEFLVVASSPEAAMGILKTQDRLLSSRMVPTAFQQKSLLPHSLLWAECNETWKTLRTLCQTEMFTPKALEAHSGLRDEKFAHLVDFVRRKQGEVIDIEAVVFTTLFNTLSCVIFGKDLMDLEDENRSRGVLKESLLQILAYGGRIKDFGSFFPMFQRFDLQGIRKGSLKNMKKAFVFWEGIINERRALINSSTWSSEHAQSFLDRILEKGFSNNQINQLVTELLIAGSNTTTTAMVWAMIELLKNKEAMSKVQEEIKKEINSEKINESQLSKLHYLHACIKEALRLHPPVPFLLPRKAIESCEVMNYTIPKNAKIVVNLWAIGRDPKVWEDPLSFKPERFLDSKLDFKGQNFELLSFGSGRRICPGLPFGIRSIDFMLTYLIREFDWVLPIGDDPMKIDMNKKFVITLKKEKPLKLLLKNKHESST